jgi:ATP diphosphatase
MDDIPSALQGIARADKIQRRVATVGFEWPNQDPVFAKVLEEVEELRAVRHDRNLATGELGDLLFSVVTLARHLYVYPEIALSRAGDTFSNRFRIVERLAEDANLRLRSLDLIALEQLWQAAKTEVSATDSQSSFTLDSERNQL